MRNGITCVAALVLLSATGAVAEPTVFSVNESDMDTARMTQVDLIEPAIERGEFRIIDNTRDGFVVSLDADADASPQDFFRIDEDTVTICFRAAASPSPYHISIRYRAFLNEQTIDQDVPTDLSCVTVHGYQVGFTVIHPDNTHTGNGLRVMYEVH